MKENHNRDLNSTSKFISLILRHKPEVIGITLDEHGWADVEELVAGIQRTQSFNMEMLEEIVRTDHKQRYSFNEDKTLIRANQGHSIPVDVELPVTVPPKYLYHGTGQKYVESINRLGLIPKGRLYVHLSSDVDTAVKVGSRHGKPVVYRVASGRMQEDGYVFYRSVNGVWLVKEVPVGYLELLAKAKMG
ncbi:MAG: RNA 2'-phosphotransferase [Lachnospiraceae bacterium]|nr:RNA 2'-phosphotransferase [Lachnospiraceae bacterium]